jgi:hypothetical protein
MEVKVEFYTNRIVLTANRNSITVYPDEPFTTKRLLVGTFKPAVKCLNKGLKKLGVTGLFKLTRPELHIYAHEMCDGGLSDVEERCLLEVGHSAGASKVEVHT